MRIATTADIPALEAIFLTEMQAIYGARPSGFAERFSTPGWLTVCADDASSFAQGVRLAADLWEMTVMLPQSLTLTRGAALIKYLLQQEHALRPMRAATVLRTTWLDQRRAAELSTATNYRTYFSGSLETSGDGTRIVRTFGDVAKKLKITI